VAIGCYSDLVELKNLGRVTVESQSKENRDILEAIAKYLLDVINDKELVRFALNRKSCSLYKDYI
jgi:hypothetical protein